MGGVRVVELTCGAIESAGHDGGQAQWAVGLLDIESEFVVEGGEQAGGVANVLKFVQQTMDVPGHAAGDVAMPNTVREDDPSDVVAAGKYGGEVSAVVCARSDGGHVRFEPRECQ